MGSIGVAVGACQPDPSNLSSDWFETPSTPPHKLPTPRNRSRLPSQKHLTAIVKKRCHLSAIPRGRGTDPLPLPQSEPTLKSGFQILHLIPNHQVFDLITRSLLLPCPRSQDPGYQLIQQTKTPRDVAISRICASGLG